MAAKILILAMALAASHASPVWMNGNTYVPGVILRIGRSPNMAYGFGSGFSTNIGGISHSTSIGSSFQSGDAQAYGGAMAGAGTHDGDVFVRGVGIASASPNYPYMPYQQSSSTVYNGGFGRMGSAASTHNFGGNYGSAVSSAQTHNGGHFGAAATSNQNGGLARYQSAVSSAQNLRGYGTSVAAVNNNNGIGYRAAISSAQNIGGGFGSAVSSTHSTDGVNYRAAVSAAENNGRFGGSTSQVIQQRAGSVQHTGASSINGPGIQAAQSSAVTTGFY